MEIFGNCFPFKFAGIVWKDSSSLYLCGEFSKSTEEVQSQWMLFCEWIRCLGNPAFRKILLSVSNDVISGKIRDGNRCESIIICKQCLESGTEPNIDYNLLSNAQIHLLGKILQYSDFTSQKIVHPQGKIELLGSTIISCSPKQTVLPDPKSPEERNRLIRLFTDNIGLFIQHRRTVLNDSRMFLAPIAISNGLAYTGAFTPATLGIYLEWWGSCNDAVRINEQGMKSFICRLSGSPLSGRNSCTQVYPDGYCENVEMPDFNHLWKSFSKINSRYNVAKRDYEAYSLQQVIDKLKDMN